MNDIEILCDEINDVLEYNYYAAIENDDIVIYCLQHECCRIDFNDIYPTVTGIDEYMVNYLTFKLEYLI